MTGEIQSADVEGTWLARRGAWIVLLAVMLGAAAIRLRLLKVPFERDEGEFAYVGQLMLQGVPPFQLAYTMKLPGTHATYALAMALFGQTVAGVRLGLLLVNAATTLLLFLVGRRLLGPLAALAAAGSFACLSLATGVYGPYAHAAHFVLLPALGGILVLLGAAGSRRLPAFFWSGVLFGVAVIMKQPGGVFPAFALFWLAWNRLRSPAKDVGRFVREGAALAMGAIAPLLLTGISLALAGVFERFWIWGVRCALTYVSAATLPEGLASFTAAISRIAPQTWLLLGLAGLGLIVASLRRLGVPHRFFLVAFLVFSFLGVCPGLYFRRHYFILVLPAVALLAGAGVESLGQLLSRTRFHRMAPLSLLAVALACGQAVWAQRATYFWLPPEGVSRAVYGANPFPESLEIARYIRTRTALGDPIAVLGSEPQIYFYAGRRSASGYIYMYTLMEPHPYARAMQEEMIREIEAARPPYLVWVRAPSSWLEQEGSDELIFDWAKRFLPDHYQLVGIVVLGADHTEYFWDAEVTRAPPGGVYQILVLRNRALSKPTVDSGSSAR